MAVAQVKPSRWTYFFFGGLFLVFVGRFVWNRREQVAFVQEAPIAHTTRRLLRCVLGRDVQRMLEDRGNAAGNNVVPSWNDKIEDRLRRIAATYASNDWPSRCLPMAEHLEVRLVSEAHAMRAHQAASDVRQTLARSATSQLTLLRDVESGSLASSLASLAYEVSGLTAGAEEGWNSPLGETATDLSRSARSRFLTPPRLPATPTRSCSRCQICSCTRAAATVDCIASRSTRANAGPIARSVAARRCPTTRVTACCGLRPTRAMRSSFRARNRPRSWRCPSPCGAVSKRPTHGWQALLTPSALVWASDTQGVVRVRSTPRSGEPHWSEALTTTGAPDEIAALMLVPGENGAVRVAALRRGANSLALTMREVPSEPRAGETSGPGADANPGGEWSTFDPHVTSCVAEHTRYLLVSDRFAMRAYALHDDGAVAFQDMRFNTLGPPAERRFDLRCNDAAALLFADFEQRPDALIGVRFRDRSTPRDHAANARAARARRGCGAHA